MKNSALRSKLVELAQRVVTSEQHNEENVWTLLERVAELSIEEGALHTFHSLTGQHALRKYSFLPCVLRLAILIKNRDFFVSGHKDDGSVLKGILQVIEDSLQSDEIESKSWLAPATTVLGLLYDSRSLSVLDLPPDHSVLQTVFQVCIIF